MVYAPSLARFVAGETTVEVVAQKLQQRDEAPRQLRYHLERAQQQMARLLLVV